MTTHMGRYYGGATWAIRRHASGVRFEHRAFFRAGTSRAEVERIELDLARAAWPGPEGWEGHGVVAIGMDLVADIDAARRDS